jgi:hypothetical protein
MCSIRIPALGSGPIPITRSDLEAEMANRVRKFIEWLFGKPRAAISDALVVEEVTALMRYASEQGIDQGGAILKPLNAALGAYKNAQPEDRAAKAGEVLAHYASLTVLTKPMNGRTLLDTNQATRTLGLLTFVSLLFLLAGLGISMLGDWLANQPEPEEGMRLTLFLVHQHVLSVLEPFVWGCLGACVYLLKALYDFAQDRQFDKERLHGWWLRVVLGGTLALVVVRLFDLKDLGTVEGAELDAIAVAFLVGLGIKVVYGAFERLVGLLAEKMDLGAIRRARIQSSDVQTVPAQKLHQSKDRSRGTSTKDVG